MKKYLGRIIMLLALIILVGPVNVSFANDPVRKEKETPLVLEGLKISAGATFVVQGTINANATGSEGEDVTDGSYSADIELEKSIGDFGAAFLHLEAGQGDGVMSPDELDLFSGVNKDATGDDADLGIAELWYEHSFLDEKIVLTTGKLDATCYFDTNELANDECTQFLSDMFKNSPVIEFPDDNAGGIRLAIDPSEWLEFGEWIEFGVGIFDANADWENIADNIFAIGEITLKPKLFDREGAYRFYGWFNDNDHTEYLDTTKTEEEGYGFGVSFDQELTDIIAAFFRFGWRNEEVCDCDMSWSIGCQVAGQQWGRTGDTFGLAIGQVMPGDDYADAGNPDHDEGHFEAYYNVYINDHLSISPDLQIIWNPKGDGTAGRDDTITVLGLRAQLDF